MSAPGTPIETQAPSLPTAHPHIKQGKIGVLLVNLGTPDRPDYGAVRRYLSEFLSDRRVVDIPPVIWQPILQGIILTVRSARSARAYRKIWQPDGSPLRIHTRNQAEGLQRQMDDDRVSIAFAMNYGNPSIATTLKTLHASGCDRIAVIPLYPQYSATTTASVCDRVFSTLQTMRYQPAVRTLASFHDHPVYIDALAQSLQAHLDDCDFIPDRIMMSYHGIPQSYFRKGDPYHCHCHKTTRLVAERLGRGQDFVMTTFQSRFGPSQWLRPYTDATLAALPRQGVRKLFVACPSFISDCLETLEEIAIEGRDTFMHAGGTHYSPVPCLNDSQAAIDLLAILTRQQIAGWID